MVWLLIYGFLLQLAFNHASANSPDDNLGTGDINGYRCNSHGVCLPGAEDIAVPPRIILADNTCGDPPYNYYCPLVEGTACFGCNSSSVQNRHPPQFMIDRGAGFSTSNFETWWLSQNWWEWSQQHNQGPLTVNISISFNKSYVLTGDTRITFKFTKPQKMVLEKSTDFGQTWIPLQYFADDCQNRFQMEPSDLNCSINAVLCNEKYRGQVEGPVYFSFLNCYTKQTFWDPNIQNLTEATDLKLRLEFPETDGLHLNTQEEFLQKYFYAISDIQVFGRCQCHGHGKDCAFTEDQINGGYLNDPFCLCEHNTEGLNCERCEALYNNKTWMPATSMEEPNQCEKCECHEHAQSCTFNSTLGHGTCDNCDHNTTGYFCEQCDDKFYRNLSRTLDDVQVCLDCNCALEGVTNNGSCSQEVATIGQCECKQNVTGRRCDRCEDAYYGYTNHPVGNCIACQCNQYGTINGSLNCHQVTGQCSCKKYIDQRTCSQCKLGFYKFPNTTHGDCIACDYCDLGGTIHEKCEKDHGKCLCRPGIQNENCSSVIAGRFFPKYTYFLYEAEYQPGNYTITSNASEYDVYFTGRGYAEIKNDQYIKFQISVEVKSNFSVVLRYSDGIGSLEISLQGNETSDCPEVDTNFRTDNSSPVLLCPGVSYTIQVDNGNTNTSVKVDSLLLLPNLTLLRSYSNKTSSCLSNATTIQTSKASANNCKKDTFSTMVELFNGSLACKCSAIGANTTECEAYGGQCVCKPGVMGRTCDRCKPGFYNFTENGCTPCACDRLGSENFVCDADSGQCECKRDVEGRTCDHCRQHYYGIHTGQGCTPCNCNSTGSLNLTCDDVTGKCYCKPGVEDVSTDKCDRCQENYFNFTQEGCQACNCDIAGSRSLQCHHSSGECPCKNHATGMKCSQCMQGTFSLEEANPSGCIPCFCFNRSRQCSTARRYSHSMITQNNLTIPSHGYARLSRLFHGYHLYSYVRIFQVNFTGTLNVSQIQLHLKGVFHNASFTLNTTQCPTPERGRYCVILHEKYAQENHSPNQMQSILADINEAFVSVSGDLGNGTELSVAMGTAIRSDDGNLASHVEQCECPSHYKELSCQNCNTGFTRNISNSNAFVNCVLCSCNNRSKDCDGESGVCEGCRLSTGDHCEICGYGVDLATGCTQCLPKYWHPDIANEEKGCRACNCVLKNTLYHNSSVCNGTSGQCLCKSYVGGLQCEKCAENYYNTTTHGCRLCPECYGLLIVHVHRLRDFIREVNETVKQLKNKSNAIGDNEFGQRLTTAKTRVENIYNKANMTGSQDPYNLNMTSDELNNLTSNVNNLTDIVEDLRRQESELRLLLNKTSNWTDTAYGSLQQANTSRPIIEDLRHNIESFVQPLETAKESMKTLNHTLWNIAANLTIISESEQEKMSRVLAQAKTIDANLNNNIKNITTLQNETQALLKYAEETVNASENLSVKATNIFDMTKNILKEVNRLTELIEENKNLTRKLNDSILSPSQEYESTIKNASNLVTDAKSQTILAERVLNNTESLLREARGIQDEATAATDSARKTLNDAETTLETVQNFQNISAEATRKASRSLELINSINIENNRSIKEIMNVSKSVRDGLAYTDEAMSLADEAKRLSYIENQGITSVYNRSKVLDDHRKSTNCSRDLMENYNENITVRSRDLRTLLETCPLVEVRNVNERANESLTQSRETLDDSLETNQDLKTVQEGVLESGTKVEEIENAVRANTHQSRLDTHAELFQELRTELSKLRRAKERRAVLIKQMKERVRIMTLEIRDLESLRDSLQDLPPCSTS